MSQDIMKRRFWGLDILRICACLMVTLCHIGIYTGKTFNIGAKGVQLFFVLSGFLSIVSYSKKQNCVEYYIGRIKAIVPEYYVALILIWIWEGLIIQGIVNNNFVGLIGMDSNIGLNYFRYFLFIQCIIPSKNWLFWNNFYGFWTMSAFALFYLITPIIYKLCNKWKGNILLLWILALLIREYSDIISNIIFGRWSGYYLESSHMEWYSTQNAFSNLYCFIFGAIVAFLLLWKDKKYEYLYGLVLVLLFFYENGKYKTEILATFVVYIALKIRFLPKKNIQGIITECSKWCYWCYLTHWLFIQIIFYCSSVFRYTVDHIWVVFSIFLLTWITYILYRKFISNWINEGFEKMHIN